MEQIKSYSHVLTTSLLNAISKRISRCTACKGKTYTVNICQVNDQYMVMMHPSCRTYFNKHHRMMKSVRYPILFWACMDIDILDPSTTINFNNQIAVIKTDKQLVLGTYVFGYIGDSKYRHWSKTV